MPSVLITGANRGIGLGFTRAYLKKGWEVIATCRNPEKANELKGLSGNIEIHSLDVTDFAAVDSLSG
ncbi:MAG: SDR family NAD(P)-dependent oxidoreductase, partial [Proteobacteria bacterium]|nr:SDR family NAD(P)-dependent oxidoreductase [Pseudomonadota bacterium]